MRTYNVDVISVILRWPQLVCTILAYDYGDDFEVAGDLDVDDDDDACGRLCFSAGLTSHVQFWPKFGR